MSVALIRTRAENQLQRRVSSKTGAVCQLFLRTGASWQFPLRIGAICQISHSPKPRNSDALRPNHGTPTTPSPNTIQRHQTPRNLPRHSLLRPYSLLRSPTPSKLYKHPLSHSSPSCLLFFPQATIILLPPSSSPSSKLPLPDRPPLARPSTTFPLPLRHDLRGFPSLKLGRLATVTLADSIRSRWGAREALPAHRWMRPKHETSGSQGTVHI